MFAYSFSLICVFIARFLENGNAIKGALQKLINTSPKPSRLWFIYQKRI